MLSWLLYSYLRTDRCSVLHSYLATSISFNCLYVFKVLCKKRGILMMSVMRASIPVPHYLILPFNA